MWWTLLATAHGGWPALDPPPSGGTGSPDAALVVGIEDYLLLDDVPGAVLNAEDWFRWLTRTRGIAPARVHLLRDVEATREKIERHLARVAEEVGPGGTAWVVFVGHGAPTPDGADGVLVGADAQSDPESLYARSVSRSEVIEALSRSRGHGVLLLDTCFSGRSGRGALMPGLQPAIPAWAAAPSELTVLTAGSASQFAGPLPGAGRPAFSYLVLGALHGWGDADADGAVTAAEAIGYATEAIAATVRGRAQTPELEAPDPQRVLSRGGDQAGPDLIELALIRPTPAPPAAVPIEDLEAIRASIRAELEAERREADRIAALARDRRRELQQRAEALRAEASAAFAALDLSPDGDRDAALRFVHTYGAVRVSIGGEAQKVTVPEVDQVRAWLKQGDPAGPAHAAQAPDPDPHESVFHVWRPLRPRWSSALAEDPEAIWEPYLALHALASALRADPGPGEAAEALLVDAMAYASTWRASDDPERRTQLAYASRGVLIEGRQLLTSHHGGQALVELYAGDRARRAQLFDDGIAASPHALGWAAHEVSLRARDAPDCSRAHDRAEALAEDAVALGLGIEADPRWSQRDDPAQLDALARSWSARWLRLGARLRGVMQQVRRCGAS